MRDKSGFRKLIVWQNAKKIRRLVYLLTERFPKAEFRRVSQMRDAARSVKQNIQEGFKRGSTGEYIHFFGNLKRIPIRARRRHRRLPRRWSYKQKRIF